MGDATLAALTSARGMVGIVAHQRGKIKGEGESATAAGQQIFVTLVRGLRRGEAGELAHGPEPAAIPAGVNTARIGRLAGISEIRLVVPVLWQIGLGIKPPNSTAGDGGKSPAALLVQIIASCHAKRF